jgi:hypothetical protein
VIGGTVKNPASDGSLTITRNGKEGEATPQTASLDSSGAFSLRTEPLQPGEYTFTFPVKRKRLILGDTETVLQVKAKVGKSASSASATDKAGDQGGTLNDFDYQSLFLVPSATAVVAALLLLLFFHPPARVAQSTEPEAWEVPVE